MEQPTNFPALARRPRAETISVKELIRKVSGGEVRIPRFQRPLRWKRSDVQDLMDSIWRGYPVGSLLFWIRQAKAERVKVGGAWIDAPSMANGWWVVDGQQRITALAAVLLDLDHGGDRRWQIRFNPESAEFEVGKPSQDRQGIDVPLSVLGDLRRLGRWMRICQLSDELLERVEDAQDRLLSYQIPCYLVETADEGVLRAVFMRINSTGARMRADEVFQALVGAPSDDGELSLDLDALQSHCNQRGFGVPPRAEILKAVLAMSGLDPTARSKSLKAYKIGKLVSFDAAEEALSRTVDFLLDDCGIGHVSLIPYPIVFIILSRWFYLHSACGYEARNLLVKWLWRGAISGVHQRAEVSKMREQVRDIRENEVESLNRLLSRVPSESIMTRWTLGRFNSTNARSRIETLSLLSFRPQDREGHVSLESLTSGRRITREIFASRDWKNLSEADRDLAKTAANRVLLDSTETGLQSELRQWDFGKHQHLFATHLIDKISFDALQNRDVSAFLRHRAAQVEEATRAYLVERAAWDEPIIQPLEVYLDYSGSE